MSRKPRPGTLSVWAGEEDKSGWHAATQVPVVHSVSHLESTPEQRRAMGIPENLIRYSVGIEDAADLIEDLEHALAH